MEEGKKLIFTARHVFLFSRILAKLGVVKTLTDVKSIEEMAANEDVAEQKSKELLTMVCENMHMAEKEVNDFVEQVTGRTGIADLPFAEYDKLTAGVFSSEDFPAFFQSAIKLSTRILVSDRRS